LNYLRILIVAAISICPLYSACQNNQVSGNANYDQQAANNSGGHTDTDYRNSPELYQQDVRTARETWERYNAQPGNVSPADAARLIGVYLDQRQPLFERAFASERALTYSGDTTELDIDYHAIMGIVSDTSEGLGMRVRGIDILAKYNYLPAAEFLENIALDESNISVLRRSAACVVWKIAPSRYHALPDVVFDKNGNPDVKCGWLQGTDYVRLSPDDIARLQRYLREEGQPNDLTTTVRIRNVLNKYRR